MTVERRRRIGQRVRCSGWMSLWFRPLWWTWRSGAAWPSSRPLALLSRWLSPRPQTPGASIRNASTYPFAVAQYLLTLSRQGVGGQGLFYIVATGSERSMIAEEDHTYIEEHGDSGSDTTAAEHSSNKSSLSALKVSDADYQVSLSGLLVPGKYILHVEERLSGRSHILRTRRPHRSRRDTCA